MPGSLADDRARDVGHWFIVGAAYAKNRITSTYRIVVGAWSVCLSCAQEEVRPKKQQEPQAQKTKLQRTADQREPQAKKCHKKARMLVMCSYCLLRHVARCESRTEGSCGGKKRKSCHERVATICERKQSRACTHQESNCARCCGGTESHQSRPFSEQA